MSLVCVAAALGAAPASAETAELPAGVSDSLAAALPHSVSASTAATPVNAPVVPALLGADPSGGAILPTARAQRLLEEERIAANFAKDEARRAEERAKLAHEQTLRAAIEARTAEERRVAQQLAVVQGLAVQLAAVGRELASQRADTAQQAQGRLALEVGFLARATSPELSGPAATRLFVQLDTMLGGAHRKMRRALRQSDAPSQLPKIPQHLVNQDASSAQSKRQSAAVALYEQHRRLQFAESSLRHGQAHNAADEVLRLGRVRSLLINQLPSAERAALVSLGRRGLRTARRELTHTELVLRWTPSAWREMLSPAGGQTDIAAIGDLTTSIAELLLLLIIWAFVGARWRGWVTAAGPALAAEVNNVILRQIVAATLQLLHALGDELLLVAVIHMLGSLLVGDATPPELAALYAVAVAYAWYRLALQATHRYLRSAASFRGVDLTAETETRIIDSLRLAGRYSFAVIAAVVFVDHVVGAGFLSTWLRRLFWLGATLVLVVLLQRWRRSISSAYLKSFPHGKLADLVRKTSGSAAGTLVAVAAFCYVAVRGITLYIRDVAMRFEHTRRGLAYLFRLRLERHSDQLGTGDVALADLPAGVVAAFSEANLADQPDFPLVDVWPGMDTTVESVSDWLNGGSSRDVLVHGPAGIGRSQWLEELGRRVADPQIQLAKSETPWRIVRVTCTKRVTSETGLCKLFSAAFDTPESTRPKELLGHIRAGPRTLVLMEDAELLMLRSMDGLAGLRAFAEVVVGTLEHTLWVCTCTDAAWRFASSIMSGRNIFARTVELPAWNENRIRDLVTERMKHAGVTAVYDDLVIDQLDAGLAEGMRAAERFHRLLWDHADGNPREAMRVWLRSLVPDTNSTVRVRLFSTAEADELEQLGTLSRFVLASIVQHSHITVDEAARALGEPSRDCRMTLAWLVAQGYIVASNGRYTIHPNWYSAAVRYLKRKHLAFN